ncbi:MAG: lycopene cyclase domain-containing protein [Bacteroidetes bacterium]|nr:lycopene cyclase domain-containing protein [Bacteroidota bacterium]
MGCLFYIMSNSTYFWIDIVTIAGPLALSFDKKVAFFKHWKYFLSAMLITSGIYLIWDAIFTAIGVWQFNPQFVSGFYLGNLPWEEVFFFIAIPYACLFIYACLRHYFPKLENRNIGRAISLSLLALSITMVVMHYNKLYTAITFSLLAFTLLNQLLVTRGTYVTHLYVAWAISIIPMLVVNGLLTGLPILIYENAENLGIRIPALLPGMHLGIPLEDFFYNLLYMMWMVWIYEARKNRKAIHLFTPDPEENL